MPTIVVSHTTDAPSAPTTTAASPLRHAHTGPRTKSTRSYHGVNTQWSEGIMERIEELSFDGIARGYRITAMTLRAVHVAGGQSFWRWP